MQAIAEHFRDLITELRRDEVAYLSGLQRPEVDPEVEKLVEVLIDIERIRTIMGQRGLLNEQGVDRD